MVKFGQKLSQIKRKLRKIDSTSEKEKIVITPKKETMLYNAVNMDINNKCNQRCFFCFNSFWDDSVNMDEETFARVLKVLPYVQDNIGGGYGFYLSCIYEPTIHPLFLKFLSMLPEEGKNKVFFTTNLARPMDENFINCMLDANIKLINISIHTLNSKRFEDIVKSKKFNNFKNNLDLLEKCINEKDNDIPTLRFITMFLKENKDEVVDLIKYCQKHFPIESHEIRTPYLMGNNMEMNRDQYMPYEEIKNIVSELKSLDYPIDMDIKSAEDLELIENENSNVVEKINENDIYSEAKKRLSVVEDKEYLYLRIISKGECMDNKSCVLEDIPAENPAKFFKDKLFDLYRNKARAAYCYNYSESSEIILGNGPIFIDYLVENDAYLELSGWCCPDRKVNTDKLIIKITGDNGDIHYFYTSTRKRHDVDTFKEKEKGWCGGYTTYIEKDILKDNLYSVDLLYENDLGKIISYSSDNIIKLNS